VPLAVIAPPAAVVAEEDEETAESPLVLPGVLPLIIPGALPLPLLVLPPPPMPPLLWPVDEDDATWCRVPGILIRGWSKNARGFSSNSRT